MTEDDGRAVIVEPVRLRAAIEARNAKRRRALAEALAVARDIERSSRRQGMRADLLAFRRALDPGRLRGAARAAIEAAAWKLFRAGDARIWASVGGDPGASRAVRARVLRRLFVIAGDALALLDGAVLRACVREALRRAPNVRRGRAAKTGVAEHVAGALAEAGFAPATVRASLRLLKLRPPSRAQRSRCAAALLHAWPRR